MKRSRFGNWLLGVMVASGLAVLVLLAATLLSAWLAQREVVAQQRTMKSWSHQQLVALQSGEVVVQTTTQTPQQDVGSATSSVTFTTPQGELVAVTQQTPVARGQHCEQRTLIDQSLMTVVQSLTGDLRYAYQTPGRLPQESRVVAMSSDLGTEWFFVKPNHIDEPCYLVGYRIGQRRPELLGFIGSRGLMTTKPTREQGFQMLDGESRRSGRLLGRNSYIASHPMQMVFAWKDENQWEHRAVMLWEADGRRLFEINFMGPEHVRLVRDFADDRPLSLKLQQEHEQYGPDGRLKSVAPPQGFIRFNNRVEFVDSHWQTTRTIRLPHRLHEKAVTLYETDAGPIAIASDESIAHTKGRVLVHAYWLTNEGEVSKEIEWRDEPRQLAGDVVQLTWSRSLPHALTLMPATPLLSLAEELQYARFNPLLDLSIKDDVKEGSTLLQALRGWGRIVWRGLTAAGWWSWLMCLLGGVVSAAWFWKSQHSRDMRGLEFGAWCGLVFLLGPVGLLGYLTHRPLTTIARHG